MKTHLWIQTSALMLIDTLFSKTIKNPASRVRQRTKPTNKEKEFATNVVVGMGAVKAYMTAFNEENKDNAKKKLLYY